MLPTPQGLSVLGLLAKSARAGPLLASGTHGRPSRFSARARTLVVPWTWRRSPRLACSGAAAGNDAWDGATALSALLLALPDESADAAGEGTDEGGDVATDDEEAAAPDAVSYLAFSDDEQESNPTQARAPSRIPAVLRMSMVSLDIRHASKLKPSSS
jgi:hypothetical protein